MTGLLVYALVYSAYHHFYSALRLEPSDVGLNYAGVLERSQGVIFLLMGFGLLATIVFGIHRLLWGVISDLGDDKGAYSRFVVLKVFRWVILTLEQAFIFALVLLLYLIVLAVAVTSVDRGSKIVHQIRTEVARVKGGQACSDIDAQVGQGLKVTIVDLSRCRVVRSLTWSNPQAKPAHDPALDRLVYLGSADSQDVFWDATLGENLRFPSSDLEIAR